jgi:hypothetical protein
MIDRIRNLHDKNVSQRRNTASPHSLGRDSAIIASSQGKKPISIKK